jgi:thioredoxin-like negative regulator of GroEL
MSTNLLINAQKAIDRGDKAQAKLFLRELILQEPRNERAWFLLAQVVEKRNQTIDCLERVYQNNPNNRSAQEALSKLRKEIECLSPADPQFIGTTDVAAMKLDMADRANQSLPGVPEDPDPVLQPKHSPVNWPLAIGL